MPTVEGTGPGPDPEVAITPITGEVVRAIYGDGLSDAAGQAERLSTAIRRMVRISGSMEVKAQEVDRLELKGYWEIGREVISLAEGLTVRSNARRMLIEEVSTQLNWTTDRTYRSIQVGESFTEELIELAEANRFTFSASYVIIGLVKDMEERRATLRTAIENRWSAKEARANLVGAVEDTGPAPEAATDDETAAERDIPPTKLFGRILARMQALSQMLDDAAVALAEAPGLTGDEREVVYRTLNEISSSGPSLVDAIKTFTEGIDGVQPIEAEDDDPGDDDDDDTDEEED